MSMNDRLTLNLYEIDTCMSIACHVSHVYSYSLAALLQCLSFPSFPCSCFKFNFVVLPSTEAPSLASGALRRINALSYLHICTLHILGHRLSGSGMGAAVLVTANVTLSAKSGNQYQAPFGHHRFRDHAGAGYLAHTARLAQAFAFSCVSQPVSSRAQT